MTVADAVSGKESLAGVRRLLFGVEAEQLFRRVLGALLGSPAMAGPCHLRHVRFKPGHKLTAYYDVSVHGHGSRPVAATWRGHPGATRPEVRDQVDAIQADAAARGLLAPFRALAAESRGRHLRVQVAPLDLDFPQLVRVFDPRYPSDRLGIAGGAPRSRVRFVRYRPGDRHLLRYEPMEEGGTSAPVFAKVARPDDSARAFRAASALHGWGAPGGLAAPRTRLSSVRPLALDRAGATVLYEEVAGLPLLARLRQPSRDAMRWVRRAGEALTTLHGAPPSLTERLPPHAFEDELDAVAQASGFVQALLPEVGATIEALVESARELHPKLPQEPPACTHGDLKVEHWLLTQSGIALIDFDTCCAGDPALDLGTFLADLRVCYAMYGLSGLEEAQRHFRDGYCAGASGERLVRAQLYEALEVVKLTARRVQLFDQRWASETEGLIGDARLVMQRVRETLGLAAG